MQYYYGRHDIAISIAIVGLLVYWFVGWLVAWLRPLYVRALITFLSELMHA